jgi:hypothetical protein
LKEACLFCGEARPLGGLGREQSLQLGVFLGNFL